MLILKNIGNANWLQNSRTLALVIVPELNALMADDLLYLRTHNAPPLYESGVVYREEPQDLFRHLGSGQRVEEFAHIEPVLKRKWGDCDDLGPARGAELRLHGEPAEIRIQWKTMPSGKLFHILNRRPRGAINLSRENFDPRYQYIDDGNPIMFGEPVRPEDRKMFDLRGDGSIVEDPSRALGMNQPGGIPIVGPKSLSRRRAGGVKLSGSALIDFLKEF